ncbi:hypothetical protein F5Y16DRAFT_91325 [Xylariaceae sp. FL0255]|nr:hypothetical protein F5Y16DRAFT_91325 [Xylariaceae sp. FL0255]
MTGCRERTSLEESNVGATTTIPRYHGGLLSTDSRRIMSRTPLINIRIGSLGYAGMMFLSRKSIFILITSLIRCGMIFMHLAFELVSPCIALNRLSLTNRISSRSTHCFSDGQLQARQKDLR